MKSNPLTRLVQDACGASRVASVNEDATIAAAHDRYFDHFRRIVERPVEVVPIGHCHRCGVPVYTKEGFCGGCRP